MSAEVWFWIGMMPVAVAWGWHLRGWFTASSDARHNPPTLSYRRLAAG